MSFYIFCDESLIKGKKYSNFYGGLLIQKSDFEWVKEALYQKIKELNLEDTELKWQNINVHRLTAYQKIIDYIFELIKQDLIKIRIMFTDNRHRPINLSHHHKTHQYHILYYQFLKHAFGLKYISSEKIVDLEIFFDKIPDKEDKNKEFKKFIHGLQHLPDFQESKIQIKIDSIYEVDSKDHILMQCLDIVLGAMSFRLNDMHKVKPEGQRTRGKRTIAKDKLFKHLNRHIREVRPHFNISISTGIDNDNTNLFNHPYRHWLFIPKDSEFGYDGDGI
ncbi:MAG: DUF3800 domain-containing protein [Arcicella sp.]|jgi:ribonuclease HI|nr:DUF3800 domain-containing protein [Arcicella sp.]